MKKTIITISFIFFTFSLNAQVNSKKELVNTMKWLLENPQIENKEMFNKKVNEIFAWKLNSTSNPKLYIQEKVNFIMELGYSEFSNEFSTIYDFGGFIEKFENENYNEKLFEFYSINGVLKYYRNLKKLYKDCTIDYLDKLIILSDKELYEKFKNEN